MQCKSVALPGEVDGPEVRRRRRQVRLPLILSITCALVPAVAWAETPPEAQAGKLELSARWLEPTTELRFAIEDVVPLMPYEIDGDPRHIVWKAGWNDDLTLTNALIEFNQSTASLRLALHESTDSFTGLFRPAKGSFGAEEAESLQVRLSGAESSLHAVYRSRIPNPGEDGSLLALQLAGEPGGSGMEARVNQIWVDSGPVCRIRRPTTDPTPYISRTARTFTSVETHWEGTRTLEQLEWGFAQVTGFDQDWRGVEHTASRAIAAGGTLRLGSWEMDASWRAAQPGFASPATDDHEIKQDRRAATLTLGSELYPWNGHIARHFESAFDGTDPVYGWELVTEYDVGRGSARRQVGMALEWDDPHGDKPLPEVEFTGHYGSWEATVKGKLHREAPPTGTVKLEFPLLPILRVRAAYRTEDHLSRIELILEPTETTPSASARRRFGEPDGKVASSIPPTLSVRVVAKRRPATSKPYLHAATTFAWPSSGRELTLRYGEWDEGHLDWYWSKPRDIEVSLVQKF